MMTPALQYERDQIMENLLEIIEQMTSDWDLDLDEAIGDDTRLISDLAFESIDVVEFILAIEEHFSRRKMPFEKLIMQGGRYVDEILLGDTADFLMKELNKPVDSSSRPPGA